MSNRICSNCGAPCGIDSRMGSVDHYLVCECASAKNTHWVDDGRGGYHVHLNDASPVTWEEYSKRHQTSNQTTVKVVVQNSTGQDWSREDD